MLKYGLSVALLSCAGAAMAQNQAPAASAPAQSQAAPSPEQAAGVQAIQQAAMSFGQCLSTGVQGVPAAVTPEAGATSVLGGCATQRQQLVQAAEAMIATMPAAEQEAARNTMNTQLAAAETHIANAIRQARSAPPATAPAQ